MTTQDNQKGNSQHRLLFLSLTFLVVVVWPLLGLAFSHSLLDAPTEATLLFGGIIALLLVPLYLLFSLSDNSFAVAVMSVWLLLWICPSVWFVTKPRPRSARLIFLAILSAVSFGQSALGVLMILGKGV